MQFECLGECGVDWKTGLYRCMEDKALYAQVLSMFLQEQAMPSAVTAFQEKDYTAMFEHLHNLKGVAGNMGMTNLYNAVCPLVDTLRGGRPSEAMIESQFVTVQSAYALARSGIERLFAENAEGIEW